MNFALNLLGLKNRVKYFGALVLHLCGRVTAEEATFIPESERGRLFRNAWIYALIYAAVIFAAIVTRSVLPLMYVGLPSFYGAWLMMLYGLTQHAGLAEDVLDHRLNCRTVYFSRVSRFLYWEMNYHVEHHMFPMVPFHALAQLHEELKSDMPEPYPSIWAAYREIIPALLKQRKDPTYFVPRRLLPPCSRPAAINQHE